MATTLDLGNVIGPKGEKGNDGATWLFGAAAPTTQGKTGDFYINTATYDVYSKATGAWVKSGNIKGATGTKGDPGPTGQKGDTGATGAAGEDGATILFGTTAPTVAQGKTGDLFMNTATSDIYAKESGAWAKKGNLKGATGATGTKGDPGTAGAKGEKGEKGDPGAVPTFSINASGHLIATYE